MKKLCQTRSKLVQLYPYVLAALFITYSSAQQYSNAPESSSPQHFLRINSFKSRRVLVEDLALSRTNLSSSTASTVSALRKRKLDNIFVQEVPSSTDTKDNAAAEFNKNDSNGSPKDYEKEAIEPQSSEQQQKRNFNNSNSNSKTDILLPTTLLPALCFGLAGLSLTGLIVWCFALEVRKRRRKQATTQQFVHQVDPSSPMRRAIDEDMLNSIESLSRSLFAVETIHVQVDDDASSVSSLWSSFSQQGRLNGFGFSNNVAPDHNDTAEVKCQRDEVQLDDDDDDWRQELRDVVANSFDSNSNSVSPLNKDGSKSSSSSSNSRGSRTSIRRRGPLVVGQTVDADQEVCWAAALGGTRIYVAVAAVETSSQDESLPACDKEKCTAVDATTPSQEAPDKRNRITFEEQPKRRGKNLNTSPASAFLWDEDSDTAFDDVSPLKRDPETGSSLKDDTHTSRCSATGMTMVTGRLDTQSCLIDTDLETTFSPYNTYMYKEDQVDSLYSYIRRLQRFVTAGPTTRNDDSEQRDGTSEESQGRTNASPNKRLFSPMSSESGDSAILACTSLLIGQLSADNKVCIGKNPGVTEQEYAVASNRYIQDVREAVTTFLREGSFLKNWS